MKKCIVGLFLLVGLIRADFIRDDANGVVVDTTTSLMWQDDNDSVQKTWKEAIDYCEGLSLAGYDDWRLPNFNELYILADRSKKEPSIDSSFKYIKYSSSDNYSFYWSSSSILSLPNYALGVYFYNGFDDWYRKGNNLYVRCVRSVQ